MALAGRRFTMFDSTSRAGSTTALSLLLATVVAGCTGGGAAPEFDDPGKIIAQVGTQLSLTLIATDEDGDELDFAFASTIPDLQTRAQLTRSPSGAAIFRWTPQAADVGDWFVDFTASDGDNDTVLTVEIDVRSAIGGAGAPVFREPLGTGTTLDLEAATCLDVEIVIEDQDSTSVTLAQEEPIIEGAELTGSGLTGMWHWCPTMDQIDAADRYTLTLSADDATNAKTIKDYLIVLRKPDRPDCPGEPPVITHTPADETTINDLTIDATVTDDQGLKQAPLFYYSTTNPGSTPNLGTMTQLTMLNISGSTYAADVPNPVVAMSAGATATLYYVIVADDDDDATGDCDHSTRSVVYDATITNGGAGTTAICESCSNDLQCGGGGDLCVRVGAMADSYCLQACTSNAQCPSGYTCPTATVTSVNGATGRQCQPTTGSCEETATCTDDVWEDNDTRTQAGFQPYLTPDIYDLTSCPLGSSTTEDDEDYFEINLTADKNVLIEMTGATTTDLDLALQTSAGAVIQAETDLTSDATIQRCLAAGSYFIKVNAYGTSIAENDYLLSYEVGTSCAAACVDDANEPDDTFSAATEATYPAYDTDGQICSGDDDWYEVLLYDGEVATVTLDFVDANGDLDLHWHNATGTDLTPCSEASPGTCTAAQGQGSSDDEHYMFTGPATCTTGCTYFVRVHGWANAKNAYGLTIAVD